MATPDQQTSVLLRSDAIGAGVTDGRLRRSHQPVFRGVYVVREAEPTPRARIEAALAVVTPGSYVSKDIYSTPARTLGRVTKAMRSVGMPVPRLREDWRRHFPSRPGDVTSPGGVATQNFATAQL
jgi:hypothetical protein